MGPFLETFDLIWKSTVCWVPPQQDWTFWERKIHGGTFKNKHLKPLLTQEKPKLPARQRETGEPPSHDSEPHSVGKTWKRHTPETISKCQEPVGFGGPTCSCLQARSRHGGAMFFLSFLGGSGRNSSLELEVTSALISPKARCEPKEIYGNFC